MLRHPDSARAAFADLLQQLVIRCRPTALLVIRENCQATAKTASQNYLLTPPPGLALTGRTPFDAQRLLCAGLEGIRRIIREEDSPRPSSKLSTLDAKEQTTVAQHRQTEPTKLIPLVRGDLGWIVLMRLEKDRARRYETAGCVRRRGGLSLKNRLELLAHLVIMIPPNDVSTKVLSRGCLCGRVMWLQPARGGGNQCGGG